MAEIPSPQDVQERLPLTERAAQTVLAGRDALRAILERKDARLFVVVGPCSVHDPAAALDYAGLLRARELLMQIAEVGLATGSEALDPICPQYLAELITWYAIGARTTESQPHQVLCAPAAGVHRLRAPDRRGQPIDRRLDAGIEPRGREPADSGGPHQ